MALKYVVKKTTFGFDKEKAEKYVARPFNVVTVDFKMLCDRPSFGCKSQDDEKEVTTDTLKNRKIIFTPGGMFKGMIKSISIQKLDSSKTNSPITPDDGKGDDKGEGGGSGEAPDPAA